jgi:hypothetical protein
LEPTKQSHGTTKIEPLAFIDMSLLEIFGTLLEGLGALIQLGGIIGIFVLARDLGWSFSFRKPLLEREQYCCSSAKNSAIERRGAVEKGYSPPALLLRSFAQEDILGMRGVNCKACGRARP